MRQSQNESKKSYTKKWINHDFITKYILKYVHFEPFKYDILKLKEDIHAKLQEEENAWQKSRSQETEKKLKQKDKEMSLANNIRVNIECKKLDLESKKNMIDNIKLKAYNSLGNLVVKPVLLIVYCPNLVQVSKLPVTWSSGVLRVNVLAGSPVSTNFLKVPFSELRMKYL